MKGKTGSKERFEKLEEIEEAAKVRERKCHEARIAQVAVEHMQKEYSELGVWIVCYVNLLENSCDMIRVDDAEGWLDALKKALPVHSDWFGDTFGGCTKEEAYKIAFDAEMLIKAEKLSDMNKES